MATLVTLRHGESTWNAENRFTGWIDVDLSDKGRDEATASGELLMGEGLDFDVVYTSLLTRSIRTAEIVLGEIGRRYLPVRRSWRLNERHYGALQGLDKIETAEKYGREQVQVWRRSYETPPPPLLQSDPMHPRYDARYAHVPREALPSTECLADVSRRLLPFFEDSIAGDLLAERSVLVVAHGNSLRALMMCLEQISAEDIVDVEIPTGVPRVYELDATLELSSVRYLGDPEAVRDAAEKVRRQAG